MADHIFAAFNNVNILDVHLSTVLAYVGLSFVVYKSLCLVLYIAHIVRTFGLARLGLGFNLDVRKFGTWAVVTGGTDGIGKAYAEQLAEKGMSIVLVSRSAEKLKNVAEEIESKYTVPTKTITIDFTTEDMESYRHVSNELEGLDIGVLVNNVGMVYKMFGRLLEQDDREQLFPT